MKLVLTLEERRKVRAWLTKDPDQNQGNTMYVEREGGYMITIRRDTIHTPGGKWKMRYAYFEENGRPTGDVSGPIPEAATAKHPTKGKNGKTYPLVEKFEPLPNDYNEWIDPYDEDQDGPEEDDCEDFAAPAYTQVAEVDWHDVPIGSLTKPKAQVGSVIPIFWEDIPDPHSPEASQKVKDLYAKFMKSYFEEKPTYVSKPGSSPCGDHGCSCGGSNDHS